MPTTMEGQLDYILNNGHTPDEAAAELAALLESETRDKVITTLLDEMLGLISNLSNHHF